MSNSRLASITLVYLSIILLVASIYALSRTADTLFPGSEELSDAPSHRDTSLKLESVDWAQCRDEEGKPGDGYWLVMYVANEDPDYWVKGRGTMKIINAAGKTVRSVVFGGRSTLYWEPYTPADLTLPAHSRNWFMLREMLNERRSIQAAGGAANRVELEYEELIWFKRDGSEIACSWDAELVSHDVAGGPYPRHSANISIVNRGQATMHGTKVFGVVYNSKRQLIDILWSEEPGRWPAGHTLQPGKSRMFTVRSIAQTGRCIGAADPAGYIIDYWVNAMTSSGQPLTSHHSVTVP